MWSIARVLPHGGKGSKVLGIQDREAVYELEVGSLWEKLGIYFVSNASGTLPTNFSDAIGKKRYILIVIGGPKMLYWGPGRNSCQDLRFT